MIIPKKLSDNFIKLIDLKYLSQNPHYQDSEHYKNFAQDMLSDYFNVSWSLGGTRGSCWDEEGPRSVSPSDEPSMHNLTDFLTDYYPQLSHEDYLDIMRSVEEKETSEGDYYGGCMYEGHKSISFTTLAALLTSSQHTHEYEYIDFNDVLEKHSHLVINMSIEDYYKIHLNEKLVDNLTKMSNNNKKITHKI